MSRIIGHLSLPDQTSHQVGDTLYVGILDALQQQREGRVVEIHWESTAEDDLALAGYRQKAQKMRDDEIGDWKPPI